MLGATNDSRFPPNLGPSLFATIFIILMALWSVYDWLDELMAAYRSKHPGIRIGSTLLMIALESALFTYYYNRYVRCDALSGFMVFFFCGIMLGILNFLFNLKLWVSDVTDEANKFLTEPSPTKPNQTDKKSP